MSPAELGTDVAAFVQGDVADPLTADRAVAAALERFGALALVGLPGSAVYGASKGALQSLTRGAAVELARFGIRVNAVAPGLTETTMVKVWIEAQPEPDAFRRRHEETIPMGRFSDPEDVAAAVVYLASDESRSVSGASISVDGGYTAA